MLKKCRLGDTRNAYTATVRKIYELISYTNNKMLLTGSWGMIEMLLLTSLRPSSDVSTPSIKIEPEDNSTKRYSATMIDDFPAPVLYTRSEIAQYLRRRHAYLPTIPIFSPP